MTTNHDNDDHEDEVHRFRAAGIGLRSNCRYTTLWFAVEIQIDLTVSMVANSGNQ